MANGGTIEIDVQLQGTADIREGIGSISQAGKSLVETMGSTNEKLAEGLGEVGESVFGLGDSIAELKGGISNLGTTGAAGFMSLLGPIGAVITAGFALYEVYKLISGSAQEAEENQSAMAAAASDLQSKLEALAEKGVKPSIEELQKFSLVTIKAQVAKEKLQFAQEKLTKVTIKAYEADEKARKNKEALAKAEQNVFFTTVDTTRAKERYTEATQEQTKANNDLAAALGKFRTQQAAVNEDLKKGAKQEKELEERSADFLKGKVKENLEKLKALKLMQAEIDYTDDKMKKESIMIEQATALGIIQATKNEENAEALLKQNNLLEEQIKKIDQVTLVEDLASIKQYKIQKELDDKQKALNEASRNKRIQDDKREADLKKNNALRVMAELARIRQLEIEAEEDSNAKSLALVKHRYNTALKLAGDNFNQQKIARLTYENEVANIEKQAQAKRDADKKLAVENEKAFRRETALFNAQQIENDFIRENELLDLKYQEQLALVDGNKRKEKELLRRYSIEKINLVEDENAKVADSINSLFSKMGQGMAEAAVGAALMGESFKKSIVTVLNSIAKQAGVEALMETAKGIALSLNPATAPQAGAHFTAAGIFTSAALLAKGAGSALGGGGSSGGGGVASSAMGSPQSAPIPTRDRAQESEMVFNINFSGAVIYDTKKAAEQALADRVARTMSRRSRGGYRSMQ
jgi:hypothetical protein